MQTLAASVWRGLERGAPGAQLIAHGGSNRWLPAWLIRALPRAALMIGRREVDSVITGDALMYALVRPLIVAGRTPHATLVHGLDITYPNRLYRSIVHPALRSAHRVIANSQATANAARAIGVRDERIAVLRLGITSPAVTISDRREAGEAIRRQYAIGDDDLVVLSLGRLVRRKGLDWFIRRVLPQLPDNFTYIIAGDGPLAGELHASVARLGIAGRVRLLGVVDDTERERLLRGADLFVQPNVRVAGDMEGFGLVLVEAVMRGTPVVASAIDGILDALIDDVTGVLLPPEDETAWIDRLRNLLSKPGELGALGPRFMEAARQQFSEEPMSRNLLQLLAGSVTST